MKLDSERQTSYEFKIPLMWNLKKKDTNEFICITERNSQTLKNLWLLKGTIVGQWIGGLGLTYTH